MRFGKNRTPPPYLNRRDQLRMLAMVGILTLVVIAMKVASKPDSWYWLTGTPRKQSGQKTAKPSSRDIDHSIRIEDVRPLPPGVFRARVGSQPVTGRPEAVDSLSTNDSDTADSQFAFKEPDDSNRRNERVPLPQTSRAHDKPPMAAGVDRPQAANVPRPLVKPVGEADFRVEIDAAMFAHVEDNTLGIRRAEKESYDYVLAKARETPLSYLERAAQQHVAFAVLMTDSNRFRGQLITVEGEIWRLLRFPASRNQYGIEYLYEAWLVSADSGDNFYRFVCTSLPDQIPQGERLEHPLRVRVTGYFFKRFGYAAEHGLHTAPLLLGKRPRWFPPGKVTQAVDLGLTPYVLSFVIVVGAALGLMLWRFSLSDREFQQSHLKRLTAAPQEAIATLNGVETCDLDQFFQELSQQPNADDMREHQSDESS